MSSMKDQLSPLGSPRDLSFGAKAMEFLRDGGTVVEAKALVDRAAEQLARRNQSRQTSGDAGGRPIAAGPARVNVLPASPTSSDPGAKSRVPEAAVHLAPPDRSPSPQQRAISARNAQVVATTIMDTLVIDKKPIGEWTIADARRESGRKTFEGYILREATRVVANARSDAKIRYVLKVEELQLIQQRAAEFADAA